MSSNYPPGYSGAENDQGAAGQQAPGEVYVQNQRGAPEPDLDQAAPELAVNETSQLNKKALLFLAGIVGSLLLMAFWFVNSLSTRDNSDQQRSQRAPVIETPEEQEETQPIGMVDDAAPLPPVAPVVPPPPLPVVNDVAGSASAPSAPETPSLVERRIGNVDMLPAQGMGQQAEPAAQAQASVAKSTAKYLRNPDALLVRGAYIRCVLETRIITDLSGFTSCIVSEPVYSINGRSLLLPAGTKLLGTYDGGSIGRDRVAVTWDRAITPTGIDVTMSSPGVDNLGSAGHVGQRDAHWGNRITTTVLVSLLSDLFKYAGQKYGPSDTVTMVGAGGVTVLEQPFQSNTAKSVEDLAQQAIQDSAMRKPTITLNQGLVVNVYVSQDIDFSAVLSRH